jgi:hypothetical protein
MSGNRTGFDDADGNDLHDPALRRALDHAPDRDALPEAHTRDAILKMAHNLAAQPASTSAASATAAGAANSASVLPWWRRLFGGGGEPRSRMPWNAAFATVLVAAFVTVLWRSEPVPEARLDGEARVGGAAAPAAEAPAAPCTCAPAPAPTGCTRGRGCAQSRATAAGCGRASARGVCAGAGFACAFHCTRTCTTSCCCTGTAGTGTRRRPARQGIARVVVRQ